MNEHDREYPWVTAERLARMRWVAERRTRFHTFVLDEVHKGHNVSAIMRSLDGFGFQDVYCVHWRTTMVRHPGVSRGAEKWLDMHRCDSAEACIETLKKRGYRIVVTAADGVPLPEADWLMPSAIVMGAELDGVSAPFVEAADCAVSVPMTGFTTSFNVSVAAACIGYHLRQALESRPPDEWLISTEARRVLIDRWTEAERYQSYAPHSG